VSPAGSAWLVRVDETSIAGQTLAMDLA